MRRLFPWLCLSLLAACAAPPKGTVRIPTASPERLPPDQGEPTAPTDLGQRVADRAREYLGTPYRYGGQDPRGMDCSGLVCRVFQEEGRRLPRSSADQYEAGQPVPPDQLRKGDLLFFGDDRGEVNHVGIYVGQGRFIHASTGQREVVEDTLRNQWFRERFLGARRIGG